jgi:ubiquinone/menaquinone biosynthesis C-methylase UbiE
VSRNWKAATVEKWNADPCGADNTSAFASPEFFANVERDRYDRYAPWLKPYVDFESFKGSRVLEVGFGLGTDHITFARAGATPVGVDLTPRHIEATAARFANEGRQARLTRGDAEALPFGENHFDAAYSFGVLHHTPDTATAVREIHRVLRPGGIAIVGLYHTWSAYLTYLILTRGVLRAMLVTQGWRRTLALIENPQHTDAVPLVKTYSRAGAAELFKDFTRVDVTVHDFTFGHLGRLGSALEPWCGRWQSAWSRRFGWYVMIRATK